MDEDSALSVGSGVHAFGFAVCLGFMLAIGIWILPFILLVALGTAAIAISSSVVFWIFGPPEPPTLPKPTKP